MAKIVRTVDFSRPIKLEVGSGANPIPGYVHVDLNEFNPELDIQCEMGIEALPIPDGCCEEILSNHSIEHIKWPDLQFLIKDWHRVLKPGGKIFIRTPDFEFIIKMYLEGKTTREHPLDESNMVRVFGDCSAWHWAQIKLFASPRICRAD